MEGPSLPRSASPRPQALYSSMMRCISSARGRHALLDASLQESPDRERARPLEGSTEVDSRLLVAAEAAQHVAHGGLVGHVPAQNALSGESFQRAQSFARSSHFCDSY